MPWPTASQTQPEVCNEAKLTPILRRILLPLCGDDKQAQFSIRKWTKGADRAPRRSTVSWSVPEPEGLIPKLNQMADGRWQPLAQRESAGGLHLTISDSAAGYERRRQPLAGIFIQTRTARPSLIEQESGPNTLSMPTQLGSKPAKNAVLFAARMSSRHFGGDP
ncbi:hypothetical protein O181_027078 [Austropuccinia psidii MF-1]|uniref:Uncharacterized protein n=1 Tax=Austropuccinia psidii MF-1 TaxID=1389203 RepID=A0A9Q3CR33_9BASI|nr:hypothetical protein [Austropuccinia psidii MF-1]